MRCVPRPDYILEPDRLTVHVLSNSQRLPLVWYQVTVAVPKSKKGFGGTPMRRFAATCTCTAGIKIRGSRLKQHPRCCHIATTYAYFFNSGEE